MVRNYSRPLAKPRDTGRTADARGFGGFWARGFSAEFLENGRTTVRLMSGESQDEMRRGLRFGHSLGSLRI